MGSMVALAMGFAICAQAVVKPGEDLQAVLDQGEDLALMQGRIYDVAETLRYTKAGQRIYTEGAAYPAQYATLRVADSELMLPTNEGEPLAQFQEKSL